MRILVATDAWRPQVNGVVRTYERLDEELRELGVETQFLTSDGFTTVPCPTYPEIPLALPGLKRTARTIETFAPDAIHIATEGPIGWAVRGYCLNNKLPFTTSFHTRFPEYLHARTRAPLSWSYAALRLFHNAGAGVMASTPRLAQELAARGFRHPMLWTRGVDAELFRPRPRTLALPQPIFLYAGRLAVEKNLEAFLSLDLPGSKVVVGDGPARADLEARYPGAHFLGLKTGDALAGVYASADVFVFPSLTDTFGIVLLEAMASGVPVAAFPAPGPVDVVDASAGVLSDDLRAACIAALDVSREAARAHALRFTWKESARQFIENVHTARVGRRSVEEREAFDKRQLVDPRQRRDVRVEA